MNEFIRVPSLNCKYYRYKYFKMAILFGGKLHKKKKMKSVSGFTMTLFILIMFIIIFNVYFIKYLSGCIFALVGICVFFLLGLEARLLLYKAVCTIRLKLSFISDFRYIEPPRNSVSKNRFQKYFFRVFSRANKHSKFISDKSENSSEALYHIFQFGKTKLRISCSYGAFTVHAHSFLAYVC